MPRKPSTSLASLVAALSLRFGEHKVDRERRIMLKFTFYAIVSTIMN
jgi:hypothetical protein